MLKEKITDIGKFNNQSNLGCGRGINMHTTNGFICGVPNAWGTETFCEDCKVKMKAKWREEDIELWKLKGCKVIKLK